MKKSRPIARHSLTLAPLSVEEAVSDLLKLKPSYVSAKKGGKSKKESKKK